MENFPPWDANSSPVKKFHIYLKSKSLPQVRSPIPSQMNLVPPSPQYRFKTHYHPIYTQVVKPVVYIYFFLSPNSAACYAHLV